jgi:ribonuclease BN (tRNA processing enzyme)
VSASPLQLVVVGSSSAAPRPGRACSSYLVRTLRAAVVLDLGNGALGKLQLAIDYRQLDAIVVSHLHGDHFLDVIPLRFALKRRPSLRDRRLPLWLPPGGAQMLRQLCGLLTGSDGAAFLDEVFDVREYDPAGQLQIGDARLTFAPARHYIPAYAIRAACDGASIVYSADTAPCRSVVELGRGASLFLCEATLGLGSEEEPRGHSSAYEAGAMAQRAGVERLVLTHYSAADSADALVAAARERFEGPVLAAEDGVELSIP